MEKQIGMSELMMFVFRLRNGGCAEVHFLLCIIYRVTSACSAMVYEIIWLAAVRRCNHYNIKFDGWEATKIRAFDKKGCTLCFWTKQGVVVLPSVGPVCCSLFNAPFGITLWDGLLVASCPYKALALFSVCQ